MWNTTGKKRIYSFAHRRRRSFFHIGVFVCIERHTDVIKVMQSKLDYLLGK